MLEADRVIGDKSYAELLMYKVSREERIDYINNNSKGVRIMALIICPECESEVSSKATACPKCGCPITADVVEQESTIMKKSEKRMFNRKAIILVAVAIFVCIAIPMVILVMHTKKENDAKRNAYINVTPKIIAAYEDGLSAARMYIEGNLAKDNARKVIEEKERYIRDNNPEDDWAVNVLSSDMGILYSAVYMHEKPEIERKMKQYEEKIERIKSYK